VSLKLGASAHIPINRKAKKRFRFLGYTLIRFVIFNLNYVTNPFQMGQEKKKKNQPESKRPTIISLSL